MTPKEKIKLTILATLKLDDDTIEPTDTGDYHDAKYEFRYGEYETNIAAPSSRHYESKSVAAKTLYGWVGWTYWFGGGKHGEPEAIDWMEDAYHLRCDEREELTVVRTWSKIEQEKAV